MNSFTISGSLLFVKIIFIRLRFLVKDALEFTVLSDFSKMNRQNDFQGIHSLP
jgi:hypothetical protein